MYVYICMYMRMHAYVCECRQEVFAFKDNNTVSIIKQFCILIYVKRHIHILHNIL